MQKKMMKYISDYLWILLALLVVSSCQDDKNFTVKGVVSGADGQTMYLENVGVSAVEVLDSVKLSSAGKFEFKQALQEEPGDEDGI